MSAQSMQAATKQLLHAHLAPAARACPRRLPPRPAAPRSWRGCRRGRRAAPPRRPGWWGAGPAGGKSGNTLDESGANIHACADYAALPTEGGQATPQPWSAAWHSSPWHLTTHPSTTVHLEVDVVQRLAAPPRQQRGGRHVLQLHVHALKQQLHLRRRVIGRVGSGGSGGSTWGSHCLRCTA